MFADPSRPVGSLAWTCLQQMNIIYVKLKVKILAKVFDTSNPTQVDYLGTTVHYTASLYGLNAMIFSILKYPNMFICIIMPYTEERDGHMLQTKILLAQPQYIPHSIF